MRNAYDKDITMKRPAGEDVEKTHKRLLEAIALELFPVFGAAPPKLRRGDEAILALLGPSKAPAKTPMKSRKPSKPSSRKPPSTLRA